MVSNHSKPTTRKTITLKEKIEIIKYIECKNTKKQAASKFKVSPSAISGIWKNRNQFIDAFSQRPGTVKRIKDSSQNTVDIELRDWFLLQRSRNIPISGDVLIEKANLIAKDLGIDSFNCTQSWIQRFKRRHNLTHAAIIGEAASVDQDQVKQWLEEKWPALRAQYGDHNIFNGDETGLFYQLLPNKTLKVKGEKCVGGKLSRERLTIWLCASMSGEKVQPLIIGKFKNPRCFKHVDKTSLNYANNQNAWMTSIIFKNMLYNWDSKLRVEGRFILLLIDNCSSHPDLNSTLTNIKLVFLPPNTTSCLQPMDAGVIKNFKHFYRKKLVSKMISFYDNGGGDKFKINVLDAIRMIDSAWTNVKPETIQNCFIKTGISSSNSVTVEIAEEQIEQDIINSVVQSYFTNEISYSDFMNVDADLLTGPDEDKNTDDLEIKTSSPDKIEESSSEDIDVVSENITISTALESIGNLKSYFENRGYPDENAKNALYKLENQLDTELIRSKTRQLKITDFLTRK